MAGAGVLDGHLALVTGGAHGIGASIVSRLELDGARVVVADLASAVGGRRVAGDLL